MAKLIPQTSNNGVTALQAGVNNTTDVTLVVVAGSVLPQFRAQEGSPAADSNKYCAVTVVSVADPTVFEVMHATDVNGNNITVERAQEGTSKQTFIAGDIVSHRLTAEIINQVIAYARNGSTKADILEALFPNVDGAVSATDEDISLLAGLATAGQTLATDAGVTAAADAAQAGAEATAAAADAAMADGNAGDPLVARLGAPGWLAYVGNGDEGVAVTHAANANIAAGIHRFRSFTIDPGIVLTQNTRGPLIILSVEPIVFGAGSQINAAGQGAPGGSVGQVGADGYLGGAGGSGQTSVSGLRSGGLVSLAGAPTQAQIDALFMFGSLDWIKMLYGGGAGGGGGDSGAGGAGGGLVMLVSRTSIDIPAGAVINASGAAGAGGTFEGGGGGGGSILLLAPTFTNDAGTYNVAGGVGPGDGTDGAAGWKASITIPGLNLTAQ